ncbi:mechanosensitive ion channel [Gangjinia marincola]|uniref:Mechanosensitive ion channel n=2 Tax=Gangjinia marincola TaxID=578463 RepID=A0ABN1ME09_9FLAO
MIQDSLQTQKNVTISEDSISTVDTTAVEQSMVQEGLEKVGEVIEQDIWGSIKKFLDLGLHLGEGDKQVDLTIGLLLLLVISLIVTNFFLKWVRGLVTRKMVEEDKHKFISLFKFINYVVYIAVFLITLNIAGVNVTVVLAASAGLLLGLGLALQELFQDVIGGIFIILDKSLLVGDIIELEDGKVGRVLDIKLRTTRALTRDDKIIIIPNHKFISDTIFNYTQNHKQTRENVSVGVAYGSDTELVRDILLKVASEQRGVLKSPQPFVLFEDFGDSSLDFSIYFIVRDSFVDPKIKSEMRFRIDKEFRENGITIPFPQRDVHLFQYPKKDEE